MPTRSTHIIRPLIDRARCIGCGLCEQLCPTRAVEVQGNRAIIVRPEDCTFGDVRESYYPAQAIGRPYTTVFGPAA